MQNDDKEIDEIKTICKNDNSIDTNISNAKIKQQEKSNYGSELCLSAFFQMIYYFNLK